MDTPNSTVHNTPTTSTAVVRPNTPAKPRLAANTPMMDGARMLPTRPNALANPLPLARIQVGNTSGV